MSTDTRALKQFIILIILHSVDLDIEGGLPTFYSDFVNRLRTHMNNSKKKCVSYHCEVKVIIVDNGIHRYYITAAPQCPFPDANIGEAIDGAPFDAVYVQFCEQCSFTAC